MTSHEIVFEKKVGDEWEPIPSMNLQEGDIARMCENGNVLEGEDGCAEFRVGRKNGVDPDSARSFDLALEPIL